MSWSPAVLRAITAKRDPRPASRLVELYAHRLYGLAYRVLGDSDAAESSKMVTDSVSMWWRLMG